MKQFILVLLFACSLLPGISQKEENSRKLTPEESRQLLSQLKTDSTKINAGN